MKTFRLLIKREFFQIFKFNKILHGERKESKKYISVLCTVIVVFFIFAVYWFSNIYQICLEFQSQQELLNYLIKPLVILAVFIVFLSTFMKGSGVLYSDKSIDILFAYPIKVRNIVFAKLFFLYLWGLAITFALLIVPLIRYELMSYNILFAILDLVQILFLPVIPILLGIILGYVLYRQLGNFFQSGSYIRSILYLVLFIGFMAFMFFVFNKIDFDFLYRAIIEKEVDWNNNYGIFFSHGLEAIILAFAIFLVGGLLVAYISKTYKSKCFRLQVFNKRKNAKKQLLKKSTKSRTLLIREMRRYFSTPIYVLNTMLGIILLLLFTAYSFLKSDSVLNYVTIIGNIFGITNISVIFVFVVSLLIVLSNTTYASISIEGKHRDILKSLPVSLKELLLAKYQLHLLLTVPIICITSFVLGSIYQMNSIELTLCLFLPITVSAFVGILGLFLNLLLPNYEWENVTYIVKQSIPAISTVFLSILIVGSSLWCLIRLFNHSILIASYILGVLYLIFTIIVSLFLKRIEINF